MKIVQHLKPFKLTELPLTDIHVIDNWLTPETQKWFNDGIDNSYWSLSNCVLAPDGSYNHRFWGIPFYNEDAYYNENKTYLGKVLNIRLQKQFGFTWKKLSYMGMNGQTQGQEGTIHIDSESSLNLSFLYYNNKTWKPEWGGQLHFYVGEKGKEKKVASVDFVPNRLLVFDGRIPHQADAPIDNQYQFRTSLVIRGEKAELI
jgi:hypothetical protein